jgi:hypothetical protein
MRNFTAHEAAAFISECLNVHPVECKDDGKAFTFSAVRMDRDSFETELKFYAVENNIDLDFEAVTYTAEDEVLTVRIPYEEAV